MPAFSVPLWVNIVMVVVGLAITVLMAKLTKGLYYTPPEEDKPKDTEPKKN